MFSGGSWGPICADHWGINEAQVVCRELGLDAAIANYQGLQVSKNTQEGFLRDVQCEGNESSIFLCPGSNLGVHECNSTRSAVVRCSSGSKLNSFNVNILMCSVPGNVGKLC